MRICILTIGSRGDIQPCIALGVALKAAGHQVRIATHSIFQDMANTYGLDFFLLEGNPMEMMEQFSTAKRGNLFQVMRGQAHLMKEVLSIFGKLFDDAWNAAQDADLIISANVMVYVGSTIAEKLQIPSCGVSLQPTIRTRVFPSPFMPFQFTLGGAYNLFTHDLIGQVLWQETRISTNKLRKRLALSPFPFLGTYRQFMKQHYPFLCAYSQFISPTPSDWGSETHVTGYWFLDPPTVWQPPEALVAFLAEGPPPIFIGFGSTTISNSKAMTALVLETLAQTGQRGIISRGWGGLSDANLPATVFAIDDVPFDWLFPRMAALVHHGGAGTSAYGFRAGVPSIIIPFMLDHFFWGRRAVALGVGPQPIPPKRLTTERLARAISIAVNDQEMRNRAFTLGRDLQAERGTGVAADVIEALDAKMSQHLSPS